MSDGRAKSAASEFGASGIFATRQAYYLLWMEFLAVSPSYELARRYRAGKLNGDEHAELPADFDKVLAVYDDLGNVQRIEFRDWWRERGLKHFGFQSERPRVRGLGSLRSSKNAERLHQNLDRYINDAWVAQAEQTTLLAAIPVGLSKTQLMRQLEKLLAKYDARERKLTPDPPKYPLLGQRQRKDTLFRYLWVLWVRSAMHKKELWRVGVRARVSDTYSRELAFDAKLKAGEATYDRMMLSVITSRAYKRGVLIAENAARGRFPSYASFDEAVMPDLPTLYRLIAKRRRWQKGLEQAAAAE